MDWESNSWGAAVATVGFGVKDSRGREVGAVIMVSEERSGVRVTVHAARNGELFGAWPGSVPADSVEDGKTLGTKKAEAVRQRVLKASAKSGGVYLTAGEANRMRASRLDGDAECTGCGNRFWSAEGHRTLALCGGCK